MQKRTSTARHFTVLGTLQEAWKLIPGSQWPIFAPLLTFIALSGGLFIFFGYIFNHMGITDASPHSTWVIAYTLASVFLFLVTSLFLYALAGILNVTIRRVRTHHIVSARVGFEAFSRFFPVLFTTFFIALFLILPIFLMAIHIVIYSSYVLVIGVLFCLSLPLVVDKTSSPFAALTHSAKITSRHFLKILCMFIVLILIYVIALIPLGLGLYFHNNIISILGGLILFLAMLWLIPLKYLMLGVVYHKLVYKGEMSE